MVADIRTDAPETTTRRLQLLGIPADVIPGLIDYVNALNAAQLTLARETYPHLLVDAIDPSSATVADLREWFDVDPGATGTGKFVQVVNMRRSNPRGLTTSPASVSEAWSVHSVVVKATGQVCKSAGWKKGPAKSTAKATKGQVLSQYTLTVPESLATLLATLERNPGNVHGLYLYTR